MVHPSTRHKRIGGGIGRPRASGLAALEDPADEGRLAGVLEVVGDHCPFDRIAAQHRQLVCGANLAMLRALTDRLGGDPPVRTVLDPQPGPCCVVLAREGWAASSACHGAIRRVASFRDGD